MPLIPSRRSWSRASLRAFLLVVAARSAEAQVEQAALPSERVAARAWYQAAKFGMFIHWGVYSQLAQGEWVMQNRSIPVGSYEWLGVAFNPVKFNAQGGVAVAKAAGGRHTS